MSSRKRNKSSPRQKKASSCKKRAVSVKPQVQYSYSKGDCVAIESGEGGFEIIFLAEDVEASTKKIMATPLNKYDAQLFYIMPKAETKAYVKSKDLIIGPVALSKTDHANCFMLTKGESGKIQEAVADKEKRAGLHSAGRVCNLPKIKRLKVTARISKIKKKAIDKKITDAAKAKAKSKIRGKSAVKKAEESKEEENEESEESQQEESESEDEVEQKPTKKKNGKAVISKRKMGTLNKMRDESSEESEEESEEAEEEPHKKTFSEGIQIKASTQEKMVQTEPEEKPSRQRKKKAAPPKKKRNLVLELEPKPDLSVIESSLLFPAAPNSKKPEAFPYKDYSTMISNRQPLFLVARGDHKGLQALLRNPQSVSTFFQEYSADIDKSALELALEKRDYDMFHILLKEYTKEETSDKNDLIRAKPPTYELKTMSSGRASKYQFGFPVRKVMLSRGGREGNNAFMHDKRIFKYHNVSRKIMKLDMPFDMLKELWKNDACNFNADAAIRGIKEVLRRGNRQLSYDLLNYATKHSVGGYSRLFWQVLEETGAPEKVFRASVSKKCMYEGLTPLHAACINPNVKPLKKLLSINSRYDIADTDGYKLLHYAAACEGDGPLRYLLSKKNTDANTGTNKAITPLMIACMLGRTKNVKLLLEEQERLMKEAEEKIKELEMEKEQLENEVEGQEEASSEGDPKADLEAQKSSFDLVNTASQQKETPAHFAASRGHSEILELLIDSKANLEAVNSKGWTPLIAACVYGHLPCVKVIIEKGKANPLYRNKQGKHGLIYATMNGHIHIVSYLLRLGVHPDLPDTSYNTPLHYAAGYGWPDIVEYLIKAGADPNVINLWHTVPASIAMLKGHFAIASYLLKLPSNNKGCSIILDINAGFVDENGRTLVMQLISNFNDNTIEQLKFIGENTSVEFSAKDKNGMNAFHYLAVCEENSEDSDDNIETKAKQKIKDHNRLLIECGEYLLAKGADVSLISEKDTTPLILALETRNKEFALWLLQKGAKVAGKLGQGNNMLCVLIENLSNYGWQKIVRKIIENQGLDILKENVKEVTDNGESALHKLAIYIVDEGAKSPKFKNRGLNLLTFMTKELKVDMEQQIGPLSSAKEKFIPKLQVKGCTPAEIEDALLKKVSKSSSYNEYTPSNKGTDYTNEESVNTVGVYFGIVGARPQKNLKYYNKWIGLSNIMHIFVRDLDCTNPSDVELVATMCKAGINFDKKNVLGVTPLMLAVLLGKSAFIKVLLEFGADPNIVNSEKQRLTCVHVAAARLKGEVLEELIKAGGEINAKDSLGNTPLHYAAVSRNLSANRVLLAKGCDVNALNQSKRNALHVALSMYTLATSDTGKLEELLIKFGIDVNAVDSEGRTPIFYSFIKSSFYTRTCNGTCDPIDIIALLLNNSKVSLHIKDPLGNTPLHYACKTGATISAITLIKKGASLDIQNKEGNTPLGIAFLHKNMGTALYLAQVATSKQSIYQPQKMGPLKKFFNKDEIANWAKDAVQKQKKTSCFAQAAKHNDSGIMYLLIANGYPPRKAIKDSIKKSQLTLAYRLLEQYEDVAKQVASKKLGLNWHQYTALKAKNTKKFNSPSGELEGFHQKLIELGIDPLQKDKFGRTSLHFACMNDNKKLLEIMLEKLSAEKIKELLLLTPAEFPQQIKVCHNIITYLIRKNPKLPSWKNQALEGFDIKSPQNRHFSNSSPQDLQTSFAYICYLAKKKAIDMSQFVAYINTEDSLYNGFLFTHLLKGKVLSVPLITQATLYGNFQVVQYLVGLGLDINATDSEGRTTLVYAVLNGSVKIAEFLLNCHRKFSHSQKAEVDKADKEGKNALMYCLEPWILRGKKYYPFRWELFELLLQCGADPHKKDKRGKNTVDYVNEMPQNGAFAGILKKYVKDLIKENIDKDQEMQYIANGKITRNYQEDCEKYLEYKAKKHANKMDQTNEQKVEVDCISGFVGQAEVIKADNGL